MLVDFTRLLLRKASGQLLLHNLLVLNGLNFLLIVNPFPKPFALKQMFLHYGVDVSLEMRKRSDILSIIPIAYQFNQMDLDNRPVSGHLLVLIENIIVAEYFLMAA